MIHEIAVYTFRYGCVFCDVLSNNYRIIRRLVFLPGMTQTRLSRRVINRIDLLHNSQRWSVHTPTFFGFSLITAAKSWLKQCPVRLDRIKKRVLFTNKNSITPQTSKSFLMRNFLEIFKILKQISAFTTLN